MKLTMATSNEHKFRESREIADEFGIELIRTDIDLKEIRGTLKEIVRDKAKRFFEFKGDPIVCDDSGFFVNHLGGFPGQFSAFAERTIGVEGVLKIMEGVGDRRAEFRCVSCFYDGSRFILSEGSVSGKVSQRKRGSGGFAYDTIMIPEGQEFTFAENPEYKMEVSHRRKSLNKLFTKLRERGL